MNQSKRPYHHGDLKASLIAAALQLVREKGARNFSINEASRRAGVSAAAPYRHFADKEDLLAAIILEGNTRLNARLEEAALGCVDARLRLVEVGVAYVCFAHTDREFFEVMFHSGIDKSRFPELQVAGRAAFSVGQKAAEVLAGSTDLALLVWTMAHGLAELARDEALALIVGSPENLASTARSLITAAIRSSVQD